MKRIEHSGLEPKQDCFGYKNSERCDVLSEMVCKIRNCTFYKTKEQCKKDKLKYDFGVRPGSSKNIFAKAQEETYELCRSVTDEYCDALFEAVTTRELTIDAVARKHFINEKKLYQLRREYYKQLKVAENIEKNIV